MISVTKAECCRSLSTWAFRASRSFCQTSYPAPPNLDQEAANLGGLADLVGDLHGFPGLELLPEQMADV